MSTGAIRRCSYGDGEGLAVLQLRLFGDARGETAGQRRRDRVARAVAAVAQWVQLDLLAWVDRHQAVDDDDDPLIAAPIVHRVVLALEAEPPQTSGIRSVFDMAAAVLSKPSRPPKAEQPEPQRYGVTHREVGITRHVARRHDETEEWQERERQRRARQRVPKPTRGARTRSRKLLDLIGTNGS